MSEERVQKVLSRMGFGSRREIEGWIEQGRVKVNGKPCSLGDKVSDGDRIEVNGKRIIARPDAKTLTRVIMYHKPEGEVCTRSDPENRPTVFEHLPKAGRSRWISIGRLDLNTSGLLLFTNNGELANRMMHPSNEVEREYAVRVNGKVTPEMISQLTTGVMLEDGPAHFDDVEDGGGEGYNHWYYVVIKEGRNREVRRLWEAVGARVSRLIRTRYGSIIMPRNLRKRKASELDEQAVAELAGSVGLEVEALQKVSAVKHAAAGVRRPGVYKPVVHRPGTGKPGKHKPGMRRTVKKSVRRATSGKRTGRNK